MSDKGREAREKLWGKDTAGRHYEGHKYVIENPEAPAPAPAAEPVEVEPEAGSRRRFGLGGVRRVRDSNPRTGLGDPRLAIWLYTATVVSAFMFSSKWGDILAAVSEGAKKR